MYLPKVNLQQIQQFKEKYLNRNIVSYLICVVIASILWFLNTLSKDYLTEITYPVKYTNFPAGKYPVAELPTQIQLTVKAKGFALLGHSIRTSFLPITFNVGSYCNHALSDKAGIQEFILNTNDIKDKISSQLNTEIQLQSVAPEEMQETPWGISIHAPRTGSDQEPADAVPAPFRISIHAPRTGSDRAGHAGG